MLFRIYVTIGDRKDPWLSFIQEDNPDIRGGHGHGISYKRGFIEQFANESFERFY